MCDPQAYYLDNATKWQNVKSLMLISFVNIGSIPANVMPSIGWQAN